MGTYLKLYESEEMVKDFVEGLYSFSGIAYTEEDSMGVSSYTFNASSQYYDNDDITEINFSIDNGKGFLFFAGQNGKATYKDDTWYFSFRENDASVIHEAYTSGATTIIHDTEVQVFKDTVTNKNLGALKTEVNLESGISASCVDLFPAIVDLDNNYEHFKQGIIFNSKTVLPDGPSNVGRTGGTEYFLETKHVGTAKNLVQKQYTEVLNNEYTLEYIEPNHYWTNNNKTIDILWMGDGYYREMRNVGGLGNQTLIKYEKTGTVMAQNSQGVTVEYAILTSTYDNSVMYGLMVPDNKTALTPYFAFDIPPMYYMYTDPGNASNSGFCLYHKLVQKTTLPQKYLIRPVPGIALIKNPTPGEVLYNKVEMKGGGEASAVYRFPYTNSQEVSWDTIGFTMADYNILKDTLVNDYKSQPGFGIVVVAQDGTEYGVEPCDFANGMRVSKWEDPVIVAQSDSIHLGGYTKKSTKELLLQHLDLYIYPYKQTYRVTIDTPGPA